MKNLRAISLLFAGNIISGISQGISMIAIPWYFSQLEKMELFGLVFLVSNIISFFWVSYAGTLVDKYDRRKLLLCIEAVSAIIALSVAGYGLSTDAMHHGFVLAIFVMTFLGYNIHFPCMYAFVQEISEKKFYGKLSSYLEIQHQTSTIVAGAVAALLLEGVGGGGLMVFGITIPTSLEITPWSIENIILLDGITYVLAFFAILAIRYVPLTMREHETGNLQERLILGFEYLKNHKYIAIFGFASYHVFVCLMVEGFYLLAPYVKNFLEEGGDIYANTDMFYGLGAVTAGVAIRWIFKKWSVPGAIILLTILCTITFICFGSLKYIWLFFLLNIVLGLCNAGIRVLRVSYFFRYVPNQVYGRVNSIFNLYNILWRLVFISIFSIGFFHEGDNVHYAQYILAGFLFLTIPVLIWVYKKSHLDLVESY